jgi:hypothetical protein
MAVEQVWALSVPSEYAAAFTDGEQALSVASTIGGAAGPKDYHLARWFDLAGGVYTLKSVAADAAAWYVGPGDNTYRRFHTSVEADDVTSVSVYLPPGRQRIDIALQNIQSGSSRCFVAFSLSQGGVLVYASDEDDWVQTDSVAIPSRPPLDSELPGIGDERLLLPVFSMLPNWANGINERLEWLTDVMPSEAEVEQRRALRRGPRRSIEASFLRSREKRAWLDNFLVGIGRRLFLVPLWFEQYKVPGGLTIGQTTLTFPADSLAMREFRVDDLVLIIDKDHLNYEVLRVATVTTASDEVELVSGPTRAWPAFSRVIPLRRARILEPTQLGNKTDAVATTSIRFTLTPELVVEAAEPDPLPF